MGRISQQEWDRRAAKVGLRWCGPVANATTKTGAACLACGHEWGTWPSNVTAGHGCPVCRQAEGHHKRRLGTQWQERARAMGVAFVETPTSGSRNTAARCDRCGHEWSPRPHNVANGNGCPACARTARVTQEQWDERAAKVGLRWLQPVAASAVPAPCECLTCRRTFTRIPSGVARGAGCAACARGTLTAEQYRALAAARSIHLAEPVTASHRQVPATCLVCRYEWQLWPGNLRKGTGCANCAGRAPVPQAVWNERAAKVGLRWREPVVSHASRPLVACETCGHEWRARPGNVAAGQGCPMCAPNAPVDQAEWDRRATKVGLRWTGPVIASTHKTPAECLTCGHRFTPVARNVGSGQGCPACATYGFNPAEPAIVYLLRAGDGALKVGIANQTSTRLEQHRRAGWQLLRTWACEHGDRARDIERRVLAWWRDELGLPPARITGDGWTETVHEDLLDASAVEQHVDEVHSPTTTIAGRPSKP